MSQWRRVAFEQVPCCKHIIETAENPMAMWEGLHLELVKAYEAEPRQEEILGEIYAYALRSFKQPKTDDMQPAVTHAFYEKLPTQEVIREDLPNRIKRPDFFRLEEYFAYLLNDIDFQAFKTDFLKRCPKVESPRKDLADS